MWVLLGIAWLLDHIAYMTILFLTWHIFLCKRLAVHDGFQVKGVSEHFWFFLPSYFHNAWHVTFKKLQKMKQCSSAIQCSLYIWVTASWLILPILGPQGSLATVMGVKNIISIMPHSRGEVLRWRRQREKGHQWSYLFMKYSEIDSKNLVSWQGHIEHAARYVQLYMCLLQLHVPYRQAGCHLHCRQCAEMYNRV